MKKNILALSLLLGALPAGNAHALTISADTDTFLGVSYGERVLNAVLEKWQKPQAEVSGRTGIIIRLAQDGRPFSCEIRQKSTSEAVDASICRTVAEIGQFPPLASDGSGEVYLSFVHDDKAFLEAKTPESDMRQASSADLGNGSEEIDSVKNPVENPIDEIKESIQTEVDAAPIREENVVLTETAAGAERAAQPAEAPKQSAAVNAESPKTAAQVKAEAPKQSSAAAASEKTKQAAKPAEQKQTKPAEKKPAEAKQTKQSVKTVQPKDGGEQVQPPLATEPQPQTLVISREEALQPPSANLVDPVVSVQEYSREILKQASPKLRIPPSVDGNYQVVARVDVLADGTLKRVSINKSSGNKVLDDEIFRVLSQEVKYMPTPHKTDQSLWLTFNIKK